MGRNESTIKPFRLLDLPVEIRRMIFSEILGNRLIHLSHHFLDGCERASHFPVATLSKAEASLLVNATDHWSLLVCDPSLATAVEEDIDEDATTGEHNSQSSEEDVYQGLSVEDLFSSDDDGTGEASEDDVSLTEEHTIDEDGNDEGNEDDVSLREDSTTDVHGIGEASENDISLNEDFTIDVDAIRAVQFDEHGSDRDTIYSDDQSDWEEKQEIKKERSLIGHIKQDLLCYGWAFYKDRLGFGFTCARPDEGRSEDSIYEREMHLCILRTCRQVYTEATQVLSETNIFSFNDASSYGRFLDSRDAFQLRSIRKLRLVTDWTIDGGQSWYSVLSEEAGSLLGLRELWLSINYALLTDSYEGFSQRRGLRNSCASVGFPSAFGGLAGLPLNRVEVDFSSLHTSENSRDRPEWDKQERQDYAKVLREMLLSPKGADLIRQEVDPGILSMLCVV